MKDEELSQYRGLNNVSQAAITSIRIRLAKNKEELARSFKEIGRLNKVIAVLKKDNFVSRAKIEAMTAEREFLQSKIARLLDEKSQWERKYLALKKKFQSLEELKRALAFVKKEEKVNRRLAKIAMLKRLDEISLQQGNRGYLIKGGRSTFQFRAKVAVELEPLNTWSYRAVEREE
jgi:predicted RNase H-like nuclease (RuvC/YqgF family)